MDRSDLQHLIDALPDGAVENAARMLEHLINPPQPPPEIQRMRLIRQEQMEQMRKSMPPGTVGGFGGGGSFDTTTGYGHSGHTHWEDDTVVHQTHHFFKGQEIAVTERLRFTDDRNAIQYVHEAKGPKGKAVRNEIMLDLE